ncbi:MAG TPA: hypothetical protein VNA13_01105, partial [Xanthomonadales bacterium]|nr:hypothetical protein [Xanthomonadales bacterium]
NIAINKFICVQQRTSVKDFVDLYFLLGKFSIWDLMYGAEEKFRMKTDVFLLAGDLADKMDQFDSLPEMIKPLTLEKLKLFYREEAKKLAKRALE